MTESSEEIQQLKEKVSRQAETIEANYVQMDSLKEEMEPLQKWLNPPSLDKDGLEQKLRQVYPSLRELLADDGVSLVYQIVVDDLQRQIFQTQPEDSITRERLYYQAQGLQSVWVKMAAVLRNIGLKLEDEERALRLKQVQ